ncbi:MAG: hypothetical protein SFY95_11190, partial [Planctomycetota bacterium]|nr:hypothetical protein [Planctomycetota bacterium]
MSIRAVGRLVALALSAGMAAPASAQVTDWTNVNGGSWFDPANWQGGIVPHANGRSARFPSGMVITGTIDLN